LADLGKRKWLNGPESKYNDYVLYPNQSGAEEEPEEDTQVVETAVPAGTVVNLSITDIDGTETLTGENLGTESLQIYFSALPTDLPPPDAGYLEGGETASGTVAETGFLAGVREYLNVHNPGAAEGQIRVTVVG